MARYIRTSASDTVTALFAVPARDILTSFQPPSLWFDEVTRSRTTPLPPLVRRSKLARQQQTNAAQ